MNDTANRMPRWTDPRPLIFGTQRQRAQTRPDQCTYSGHVAAPRCTNEVIPGTELCTEHPRRF